MYFEQERRNSPRSIQYNRHAKLSFKTKVYKESSIQNLSLTGMFVQGVFQQNDGDHCVVNLVQKGKYSCLSLEASAQVVRMEENGVAIEFTSMSLESLMLLQMILSCDDGDESLSREIQSFDNLPFKVHDDYSS